jgi:predicted AlkP superfamily pyrophosphatase or phosphodiesterase
MNKPFLLLVSILFYSNVNAQTVKNIPINDKNATITKVNKPKLVVGLVVDQMRWDYLHRFANRFGNGGFKRLLNEGFSVDNTLIPYTPTYTACGHTSIYTGSVPAIHGIIGNDWVDPQTGLSNYCTQDKSVKPVGSDGKAGLMSPKNLLANTITDELRLASNFRSKVIGIALKDRGSILPAGHTANAAYWYDGESGNWITSTYYMDKLPSWVEDYNKLKLPNKFYYKDWHTLYPIETYTQSTADDKPFERNFKNEKTSTFPHLLKYARDKNFDLIRSTPFGNTLTLDMAKLAILSEDLGKGSETDFLAISCSATDYIGHQFGPNSIEVEDTYLRLDKDVEEFLNYLDKQVGKGEYLIFLTADHGGSHAAGFLNENKLPGGVVDDIQLVKDLNPVLEQKFKIKNAVVSGINNQILFNHNRLDSLNISLQEIKNFTINYLKKQPGFQNAVDLNNLSNTTLPAEIKNAITNGYNARRSGDIYFFFQPGWFDETRKNGGSHGAWNPYDAHIPLVFMGWGIKQGKTSTTHYMTDIAATLASLLSIQMPNGNIGKPITEITNK